MSRTILLVEDDDDLRFSLRAILVREGYRVAEAVNGREALEMARTRSPDVILMDLAMPEVNGLDAARLLRQDPATADVPIVAMTASTWFASDPETLRSAGFDSIFAKPYRPDDLLDHLRKLLAPAP